MALASLMETVRGKTERNGDWVAVITVHDDEKLLK
jgi:hypothetical protein